MADTGNGFATFTLKEFRVCIRAIFAGGVGNAPPVSARRLPGILGGEEPAAQQTAVGTRRRITVECYPS
jgi:hypothetical protein